MNHLRPIGTIFTKTAYSYDRETDTLHYYKNEHEYKTIFKVTAHHRYEDGTIIEVVTPVIDDLQDDCPLCDGQHGDNFHCQIGA